MKATQTFSPRIPGFYRAVNGSAINKSRYSDDVKGITVDSSMKSQVRRRLQDLELITGNDGNVKGKRLGLALCKEFFEIHGGTLRVESQPGKGSSFIFSLPDNK